ncbi:MAG TPA: ferrous iron transporter B [Thiobacillus sp.]|nr:MAG: ferrous iron transporter B [Hydrogenophilales bacterium 28-61-11]OYZ57812.1 MAG: ferrous iron transporter B [Hydrogenophilales bacterium 16-61-112]OZA48642.1 MAG: ferrous iron transporter B [Hydrogenophilales bacterium 17-61-76]HQS99531.1 ferrous iron transporter B [Thiobacillus sp.]HQT34728.1 ferrous iron transporter B [Thiobacillus sp.]
MSACHGASRAQGKPAVVHLHRGGPLIALVGNPNCGKTALFNVLTGSRQKVANYAGVTVERKEGRYLTAAGKALRVLDLPGTYSLNPRSPDEKVTVDVLMGRARGEKRPDRVICVVDATNLRRNLRLVLAVKRLGLPCVVALNMTDLAARRGIHVDADTLSLELGVQVVKTVAVRKDGAGDLRALLDAPADAWRDAPVHLLAQEAGRTVTVEADHDTVQRILARLDLDTHVPHTLSDRIDRVVLHPVFGMALLLAVLFLMFQAVFAWAEAPMGWVEAATAWAADAVTAALPGGWVQSLLVDGMIAGAGGVLVFLPQILILFFFILVLEESGYLPRAAFLLDRMMGSVGLSGRSFIPLLSSFACAIPGIMAARTIASPRDRLVTIMIAPLMTCSARLPVYALLIGAFIPKRDVAGLFELQGLVMFGLYVAGTVSAMGIAWLAKRLTSRGLPRPLMMELPTYHWPNPRNIAIGLWQRAEIFLKRVGGIILALTLVMWFLASFPAPPTGATGPAIEYSFAGTLGRGLATIFEPIGFNWQISVALVPGMAAREVAVSALGTVYALSATGDDTARALTPLIAHSWSLATALSLLTWFIFAPQCLSTLATVKRETGGWKWTLVMAGYLFGLAWLACFGVYRAAVAAGWG